MRACALERLGRGNMLARRSPRVREKSSLRAKGGFAGSRGRAFEVDSPGGQAGRRRFEREGELRTAPYGGIEAATRRGPLVGRKTERQGFAAAM